MLFHFNGCVVPSFPFAWANSGWNSLFSRVAYRQSGKGEGSYPAGGVGYHRLVHLRLLAAHVLREFARSPGRDVLSAFAVKFCEKMGPFLGGEYPRSSPRGGLGFRGESCVALDFIQSKIYICTTDWGVGYAQKTWKSFLRVEAT
jgi:hypothetical protein